MLSPWEQAYTQPQILKLGLDYFARIVGASALSDNEALEPG